MVVLLRGIGDVASAVAYRLFLDGHAVAIHGGPAPPPRTGAVWPSPTQYSTVRWNSTVSRHDCPLGFHAPLRGLSQHGGEHLSGRASGAQEPPGQAR